MCGISGLYKLKGGEILDSELSHMRDALKHRGPDGAANFISKNKNVGLSQRRLAIIDLSPEAACPMTNEDGTVWITFNGEIYNFQELREDLLKKGHTLKTHGDTETILHGYEEYGTDVVKRLNGMFAFVIWDEKREVLFAARDHIGIKPFYYAVQDDTFYFGSEPKAILAHPSFRKELAKENVSYYLTFACMPAPLTLFRDIKKLPAAHFLLIEKGADVNVREYWNPLMREGESEKSEEEYIHEIRSLLTDSIRKQMVSDVPFGCFLSGGIDSSTNATLMSRAIGKPVETFSVGSDEHPHYNEFEYSRKIVELLGAKSHELIVSEKDLLAFLPDYGFSADDPNGDQICFLVYYLSKLIRKSCVIVAQVGEGADELFAGYPAYLLSVRLHNAGWRFLRYLPRFLRKIPHWMLSPLLSGKYEFQKEYFRRLADGEEPFWGNAIAFTPSQKRQLLTPEYRATLTPGHEYATIKSYYDEVDRVHPGADFLERLTYLELKIRLPELLLARVDKMGMAHSIEARVPFLDKRLVELALHIPEKLKLKKRITKYILKKAVQGIIPDEIISRKKQGFGAPMTEWLKNPKTAEPLLAAIKNSKLRELGILDYDYIDRIISLHQSGAVNHNFRIWNLISLSLWYDYWFSSNAS
ncbi:MAG: asparagine synthase (glutamine-hydrolyzing) [Patescibacteria group bacterium]